MCEFFVRTAVQTVNKMLNKQNKLEFFFNFYFQKQKLFIEFTGL
ncbi:hypothetical protein CHCC15325_0028 [Bacillus licheniformis]|nr:hypothetical protein MUY_004331 [Bacillus licheniformis WX-02]TWJ44755.1 hypothetical protein CHCC5025_2323 [Bacillus licheniformis]TWJ91924.1 hypothetical protein CHCC20496_4592 [Bacillus licheniformis]TWL58881.1 hypothetical protein CHCC15325_0028 [Bacillus licheniformis]